MSDSLLGQLLPMAGVLVGALIALAAPLVQDRHKERARRGGLLRGLLSELRANRASADDLFRDNLPVDYLLEALERGCHRHAVEGGALESLPEGTRRDIDEAYDRVRRAAIAKDMKQKGVSVSKLIGSADEYSRLFDTAIKSLERHLR